VWFCGSYCGFSLGFFFSSTFFFWFFLFCLFCCFSFFWFIISRRCFIFLFNFLRWNGSLELSMNFTETELFFSVQFFRTKDDTVSQLFEIMKLVVKQDKCKLDIDWKLIGRELISLDCLHICNRVSDILDAFRKRKRTERLCVRKWGVRAGVRVHSRVSLVD